MRSWLPCHIRGGCRKGPTPPPLYGIDRPVQCAATLPCTARHDMPALNSPSLCAPHLYDHTNLASPSLCSPSPTTLAATCQRWPPPARSTSQRASRPRSTKLLSALPTCLASSCLAIAQRTASSPTTPRLPTPRRPAQYDAPDRDCVSPALARPVLSGRNSTIQNRQPNMGLFDSHQTDNPQPAICKPEHVNATSRAVPPLNCPMPLGPTLHFQAARNSTIPIKPTTQNSTGQNSPQRTDKPTRDVSRLVHAARTDGPNPHPALPPGPSRQAFTRPRDTKRLEPIDWTSPINTGRTHVRRSSTHRPGTNASRHTTSDYPNPYQPSTAPLYAMPTGQISPATVHASSDPLDRTSPTNAVRNQFRQP